MGGRRKAHARKNGEYLDKEGETKICEEDLRGKSMHVRMGKTYTRKEEDKSVQCGTVGVNNNQSSKRLYKRLSGPRNGRKITFNTCGDMY